MAVINDEDYPVLNLAKWLSTEGLGQVASKAASGIMKAGSAAVETIKEAASNIGDSFSSGMDSVKSFIGKSPSANAEAAAPVIAQAVEAPSFGADVSHNVSQQLAGVDLSSIKMDGMVCHAADFGNLSAPHTACTVNRGGQAMGIG